MKEKTDRQRKKFRNHITIILEQTGAVILALLIFAVTGVFQNADKISKSDLSFFWEKGVLILFGVTALLLISLISQLFVWSNTYISIEENAVVVETGRLNKKKNTISINNISNINLEQSMIEMLFGTCKVKLDTNSRSTADSTDVKIVLRKKDALLFQQEIMSKMMLPEEPLSEKTEENDADGYDVRTELSDILQHGVFSASIISVILFILAFAGTVVSAVEIIRKEDLMASAATAAGGILVVVLIALTTLWDTVKDFIRYYDFRAKRRNDKICIKYGFLKKVEYTIPVDKIQALKIRQSFLGRLGHRYMAEIINVGMGDEKDEQCSFLLPYCRENKLKERLDLLLPEFVPAVDQEEERMPLSVWAAWTVPGTVSVLCAAAGVMLCNELTGYRYYPYLLAAAAAAVMMLLIGMVLKYRTAGVGADGRYLKIVTGYFSKQYIIVHCRDIQYVEFSQNFIARVCAIKKGEIHLLASSVNTSHGIPYFREGKEEVIKSGMLTF